MEQTRHRCTHYPAHRRRHRRRFVDVCAPKMRKVHVFHDVKHVAQTRTAQHSTAQHSTAQQMGVGACVCVCFQAGHEPELGISWVPHIATRAHVAPLPALQTQLVRNHPHRGAFTAARGSVDDQQSGTGRWHTSSYSTAGTHRLLVRAPGTVVVVVVVIVSCIRTATCNGESSVREPQRSGGLDPRMKFIELPTGKRTTGGG